MARIFCSVTLYHEKGERDVLCFVCVRVHCKVRLNKTPMLYYYYYKEEEEGMMVENVNIMS